MNPRSGLREWPKKKFESEKRSEKVTREEIQRRKIREVVQDQQPRRDSRAICKSICLRKRRSRRAIEKQLEQRSLRLLTSSYWAPGIRPQSYREATVKKRSLSEALNGSYWASGIRLQNYQEATVKKRGYQVRQTSIKLLGIKPQSHQKAAIELLSKAAIKH